MVLPENQRMGLGRILTDKINSIADEKGAAVYARARPNAAALFRKMGYVDVERIDVDFAKYGGEGKETAYVLIRQPGAKN
jgi:ribosomal protein S18 acetylase RimI-like enzyme